MHPLHANVSSRLRPLPERPRELQLKISVKSYHRSSHQKESSVLWKLARSEVFIISKPPHHPRTRNLHNPTSMMPRRQVRMLAIGPQSAIHNRLQCLASSFLQLRTYCFILPSHALYRPRLVVRMPLSLECFILLVRFTTLPTLSRVLHRHLSAFQSPILAQVSVRFTRHSQM